MWLIGGANCENFRLKNFYQNVASKIIIASILTNYFRNTFQVGFFYTNYTLLKDHWP